MRALAAALCACLLAAPAAAQLRGSVGYRFMTGSGNYVGNALLGRARLPLGPKTAGYGRLDLVADSVYDRAYSAIIGLEQGLGALWLAWLGAGASGGELEGGTSASSFLLETGAGRSWGAWWADTEYRLAAGEVGRVLAYGPSGGSTAHAQRVSPALHDRDREPALSSPAVGGRSFSQHELALSTERGVPGVPRARVGLSVSGWTRLEDGPDLSGLSAATSLYWALSERWSAGIFVAGDLPDRGQAAGYAGVSVILRRLRAPDKADGKYWDGGP